MIKVATIQEAYDLIIAGSVPKGGVVYVTPPHQSTAPRPR